MATEALLAVALVLVLGTAAQAVAWRFRIPSILLLLAAGLAVGPGLGLLHPSDLLGSFLEPLVALGVAVLLFEGGLGLDVRAIRGQRRAVTRLVTVGVLITWLLGAVAAHYLLDFAWRTALVLGAILVVSGPTVVLPLLRHVQPSRKVDGVLRWEGIVVDPIGALLAVVVFEATTAGTTWQDGVLALLLGLGAGAAVGWIAATVFVATERRYLVPDELVPAVGLALVLVAYLGGELLRPEAGLVAATMMGIVLANQRRVTVQTVLEFKGSLATIIVGSLFILLAAEVQRSQIALLDLRVLLFLAVLILVIRPLMVAVSTLRSKLSWKERAFVAWMAPRGIVAAAVAALFALRLEAIGHPDAERLVPVTFLVIVGTVAVYGLTARPLARRLDVARPDPQGILFLGINAISRGLASALKEEGIRCVLVDDDPQAITAARLDGLEAVQGNVLSTYLTEGLDMSGIGRMFATTHNDATNSLASVHFATEFTRAHVYQLADPDPVEEIHEHMRGRTLFGDDWPYRKLRDRMMDPEWTIHRTPITDRFTMQDHAAMHEGAVPLMVLTPGPAGNEGHLRIVTADHQPDAQPGDVLFALVREQATEPSDESE